MNKMKLNKFIRYNCKRWQVLLLVPALLLMELLQGQDLHFSQWQNGPLITNPANTGFIPEADYRIGMQYRNQWSSIMNNPYKTMSIWGDAQLFRDQIDNGWLGLGGVLLRDEAGSGKLNSTKIYGSLAYHQMLGTSHLLSLGFNTGIANKSINVSALTFPDQFNGHFFDNTLPTNAVLDRSNVFYLDIQVGLNYAFFPTENTYINGGISVWHLNRPRESFFTSDPIDFDSRMQRRYTAFLDALFKISSSIIVNPMGYYSRQAAASELLAGTQVMIDLEADGEKQLILGASYRLGDALIPSVGLNYKQLSITLSYDATMSSLKQFNNLRGGYEVSLMKQGYYEEYNRMSRQSLCPRF
jgi:hypothetical protein